MSCSFFKTYGQAQSMAANLINDPNITVLFVYLYESQAQRIREWMREWAAIEPRLTDWEERIKFHSFNAVPVLETLPKVTEDEVQETLPDVMDAYMKVLEIIKRAKEKESDENIHTIRRPCAGQARRRANQDNRPGNAAEPEGSSD